MLSMKKLVRCCQSHIKKIMGDTKNFITRAKTYRLKIKSSNFFLYKIHVNIIQNKNRKKIRGTIQGIDFLVVILFIKFFILVGSDGIQLEVVFSHTFIFYPKNHYPKKGIDFRRETIFFAVEHHFKTKGKRFSAQLNRPQGRAREKREQILGPARSACWGAHE